MAFDHEKTMRQACEVSFGGNIIGHTLRGVRIRMTPKIHIQLGEEGGEEVLNAYWGGMTVRVITMMLQVYSDAGVISAGFSLLGSGTTVTIPNNNLKVGTRIDTSTFAKSLIIQPVVVPGKKVTVSKAFGIVNGEIPLELRGDVYYPVHFFCFIRGSDTFKLEDAT